MSEEDSFISAINLSPLISSRRQHLKRPILMLKAVIMSSPSSFSFTCGTCQTGFNEHEAQRAHMRDPWQ